MSSVDTVELPSPERDHTHHQLPPSRQQDKARTHLIAEYKSEFLWVGPRGKAHPRCLKTPRPHTLKMTLIPLCPFGHMLRPYWSFLDTHGHVRAPAWLHHTYSSSRGVTDTDSSIWTSALTRHFIDLVSQIFSRQDNSICWRLINSGAIPCGFTGRGIHHFILLTAVLWDLYVTWQRNIPAVGKLLSASAYFPFEKFWLPTLKQILKKAESTWECLTLARIS